MPEQKPCLLGQALVDSSSEVICMDDIPWAHHDFSRALMELPGQTFIAIVVEASTLPLGFRRSLPTTYNLL